VYVYRKLVSHQNVPEWSRISLKSVARQTDLYTLFQGGDDDDAFERWITREYEEPGQDAIEKLLARTPMTPHDWRCVAKFVALQQLRTPLHFFETQARLKAQVPRILEEVVARANSTIAAGAELPAEETTNYLSDVLRISIEDNAESPGYSRVRTLAKSPRAVWMATMRHQLTALTPIICQHRWQAIEPEGDNHWPLADHPVLTLNYSSADQYDFGGGWGNDGTEIIMPISPRSAVYTQVKRKVQRTALSADQTHQIQRFMAERAARLVVATRPIEWLPREILRRVDRRQVEEERQGWQRWHQRQADSERAFDTGSD
jgi:hypothetical protein